MRTDSPGTFGDVELSDSEDENNNVSGKITKRKIHHSRDRYKIVNHHSHTSSIGSAEDSMDTNDSERHEPVAKKRVVALMQKTPPPPPPPPPIIDQDQEIKMAQHTVSPALRILKNTPPQFSNMINRGKSVYMGLGRENFNPKNMKREFERFNQTILKKADMTNLFKRRHHLQPRFANIFNSNEKVARSNSISSPEELYHEAIFDDENIPTLQFDNQKVVGKLFLSLLEGRAMNVVNDVSTNSLRSEVTFLMYCELLLESHKRRSKAKLARRVLPSAQQIKTTQIPTPVVKWNENFEIDITDETSILYIETFQLPDATSSSTRKISTMKREPIFSGYVSIPLTQFKHGNTIDGWYTLLSEMGEPTHGSLHLSIQLKLDPVEPNDATETNSNTEPIMNNESLLETMSLEPGSTTFKKYVKNQTSQKSDSVSEELNNEAEKQQTENNEQDERGNEQEADTQETQTEITNQLSEKVVELEIGLDQMRQKFINTQTKHSTKMRYVEQRVEQLELQVQQLNALVRILNQENTYLRTRVTEHDEDLAINNKRLNNLEEHVDKLVSKQGWRIQEWLLILLAYLLGFMGIVIVFIGKLFKWMKLTRDTKHVRGDINTFDEIQKRLEEKRQDLERLATQKFTVPTITQLPPRSHSTMIEPGDQHRQNKYDDQAEVYSDNNESSDTETEFVDCDSETDSELQDIVSEQQEIMLPQTPVFNEKQQQEFLLQKLQDSGDLRVESDGEHSDNEAKEKDIEQEAQQIRMLGTLLTRPNIKRQRSTSNSTPVDEILPNNGFDSDDTSFLSINNPVPQEKDDQDNEEDSAYLRLSRLASDEDPRDNNTIDRTFEDWLNSVNTQS
jgi:outer membrane murein-binding lipoprotein Lpp